MDVNEPIITTGQFTGAATILVQLLVNNYKADVNATAADGTRSIHLVCFYQPHPKQIGLFIKGHTYGAIIYTLVQTNANADAEFGRDIFLKHFEDSDWCPDFEAKINENIISLKNKTLLMYALESAHDELFMEFIEKLFKGPTKLINHRDNYGVPATHYLVHPKQYGNSTFLPNLVAYRGYSGLLKTILPYYTDMSLSNRVLYYATLPIDENSDDLFRPHPTDYVERSRYLEKIRIKRQESIQVAGRRFGP
ncbi:Protein of unknown function [Cotesia congregata]|uniref:Uncharacterized protein n=1 Tax=Cotesia congregata TaxID=51543 RepID=A0A8J2HJ01_COTCN|nr:Protein of unknown function [Cotesia congregata]